mgnify:CR=1 FL=1|tara:strand:+ start:329 stop:2368 length:2040 start_codon:yes stop_codon:yes gene_type:complete
MNNNDNNFLFEDITSIKGVGVKLKKYLKKKGIDKVKDLLLDMPYGITDRSKITTLDKLEIGKIANIKVRVVKYNFPKIRNLPNKVICSDGIRKINIIFFNSNEFYIRKILPINKDVLISGKVNFYKKNYQINNPTYVKLFEDRTEILKIFPKYALSDGLTEKNYRKLVRSTLEKITTFDDWHDQLFLKKNKFNNIKNTFQNLHNPKNKPDIHSNDFRRMAFDEIFSNLLIMFNARSIIKTQKKERKFINNDIEKKILETFPFNLTDGQKTVLKDLYKDAESKYRMFRLIQGDVGSGKTILALILAGKICSLKYQVAYMSPTEILSKQQFHTAKKLFKNFNFKIGILTSKSEDKKETIKELRDGKIDLVIGTHSLFQNKIKFKNLGLIIIDEQHKFGVKQRIALAKKGGKNCDMLLMSATPIPRTMMMSICGDMDISKLIEKPIGRKEILTLVKPEKKINEVIPLLKKQIDLNYQIFWVCPLIDESKKLNFSSAINKYNSIKKIFPNKVGLIHGGLNNKEKNLVINDFLNKKIKILVSTTVIEVGIDVPNANTILIEDANKFGLSQLHQLRGRVGRGKQESICILLYKNNLSENAKKRLKILKLSNDGFKIAEEDLKLRGPGDILGYQQSGIKNFNFADPIHHKDLFILAENEIKKNASIKFPDYNNLLKLFDKSNIVTD